MLSTFIRRYGWPVRLALILVVLIAIAAFSVGCAATPTPSLPTLPAGTAQAPANTPAPALTPTSAQHPSDPPAGSALPALTSRAAGSLDLSDDSKVQGASNQAGWKLWFPAYLPQGYAFQDAIYDAQNQVTALTFLATRPLPGSDLTQTRTLTLAQAQHNDAVPLKVSPQAALLAISVSGAPAVYAAGAWEASFMPVTEEPNGGHMDWQWPNHLPVQNLYWQVGGIYLALISDDPQVTQADLISTAESINRNP